MLIRRNPREMKSILIVGIKRRGRVESGRDFVVSDESGGDYL
jgi:hypothetical protein